MKRTSFLIFLLLFATGQICAAQEIKWINPLKAGAEVHGQGWEELSHSYVRLPDSAEAAAPKAVWDLSRNSAGLSLLFRSNAPRIIVRYQLKNREYGMYHMPSNGVSGVDMFATDPDGVQMWCAPQFWATFADTVKYDFRGLEYRKKGSRKDCEFRLFLPLYNTVEWLELGIPEGSDLQFCPRSVEKPLVVYGTSIAQGACASRPGMAWTNQVQRRTGHNVVNLGFSGSAHMEEEVFDLLDGIDAKLYIIDCMQNMSPDQDIFGRTVAGVKKLRAGHDCPILLVEHSGYSNEFTRPERGEEYRACNVELRKAYDALVAEGVQGLWYMSHDDMGYTQEEMVEGVHPSDLGMTHCADSYVAKIEEILGEKPSAFIPVVQNRDPYDWRGRHEEILRLTRERQPKVVLIGDSITHFWGGDPQYFNRGVDSWDKLWGRRNTLNLGFGWDRVENVLWRLRHGELDGYAAEDVLILIGTNNIGRNSNAEIVDGILEIVSVVREKQPSARVHVCGILPRRGREDVVAEINAMLRSRLDPSQTNYIDMTPLVVGPDGKLIEKYFSDGLHPNAEGYVHFARMIEKGMKQK